MSVAGSGGVFVSYRREGGGDSAGRIADHLVYRFGAERVFMDVDAIEPGMDYVEALTRAVESCDVLVAVIGPGWLAASGQRGRRLDDTRDWVRVEIGTALERGVRVIPVLVGGAVMPAREELPEDLAGLARRNALRIWHESLRADAGQLLEVVERVLASTPVSSRAEAAADPFDTATEKYSHHRQSNAGRATRLLLDAERIANSIIVRDEKAAVLRDVVSAVAATDPERAENIAITIADEKCKAAALHALASAVAATDPERAARLFGEAERTVAPTIVMTATTARSVNPIPS